MWGRAHTHQVQCPTLLIHGINDDVIPALHSSTLYSKSTAELKRLMLLDRLGHHDVELLYSMAQTLPAIYGVDEKDAPMRKIDLLDYAHV